MRTPILTAVLGLFFVLFAGGAVAQTQGVLRIVAVVNDDVITVVDLESRIRLLSMTTGLSNTPEVLRKIAPQVLQAMIGERLKIQEAKRLGYDVSDAEFDRGIGVIEQQMGMQPGGLLRAAEANGIKRDFVYDQIRADIAWAKVVRNSVGAAVVVGDEEIDGMIEQMKANMSQPQYLLGEIFLPIDATNGEAEALAMAERMVQQIRGGASFPALAKQFSQAPTAAVGGDTGWMPVSQIMPEIRDVVTQMQPGQLALPIKTFSGYYVIILRERRESLAATGDVKLDVSQLFMQTEGAEAVPPARIDEVARRAKAINNCKDFNALATELGLPGSGPLGEISASSLPPELRDAILALPPEQASAPLPVQGGKAVVMVCGRKEGEGGLPTRAQISEQLLNQRLDMLAQRKFRDLRRQAFIDIRL